MAARTATVALVWTLQALPVEGFEYHDPVPLGFHNFFVLTVLLLALLWAMKVGHRVWTAALIRRQLAASRPLALDHMSIYAKDLQQLIRQHFNQILRMRRLVPPREVPQCTLQCHVRPESLEVIGGDELLGVRFIVDSQLPCAVRLYWGVSLAACEELLRLFPGEEGEARRPGPAASWGRQPPAEARRPGPAASWGRQPPAEAPRSPSALAPLLPQGAVAAGVGRGGQGPASSSALRAAAAPAAPAPAPPAGEASAAVEAAGSQNGEGAAAFWEPLPWSASAARSSPWRLPAGLGLAYSTPQEELLDPRRLGFELAPSAWPPADRSTPLPLLIAATTRRQPREGSRPEENRDGHTQVTLVRFRRRAASSGGGGGVEEGLGGNLYPEVLHQLVLSGAGGAHRVLGVFGFEEEEGGPAECMVCYDQPRSVVLLPCRHCSVCPSCLRSLRDEQCPLCRSAFSAYLLFPLLQGA